MANPAVTTPANQTLQPWYSHITDPSGEGYELESISSRNDGAAAFKLPKNERGWRRIVRNFSPSWFSVTMGTGIVSLIFITIPWKAAWLHYLGIIFFVLNVCLFTMAAIASLMRYIIWPEIWTVMIEDATNSFATIVEMWIFVCVPAWDTSTQHWAAYFGWALWMIDSVLALSVTAGLGILLMSASHQRSLDSITAAQLLPIAATIVAAGTGAEVSTVLANPQHALGTVIASYVMWGFATPMSITVLVMYYQRLALHKMPPREIIVSAFLPLGPLGFGGYTILYLGKQAAVIFPQTETIDPMGGRIAYVMGFFIALVMWSWGLLWGCFALATIYKSRSFPFNMGWWGFTFPLGVYACSTILIGEELPSLFFRVLGTIFGTAVILLWIVVALGTAKGAWSGELFHAQCLSKLKRPDEAPERASREEEEQLGSGNDSVISKRTASTPDHSLEESGAQP